MLFIVMFKRIIAKLMTETITRRGIAESILLKINVVVLIVIVIILLLVLIMSSYVGSTEKVSFYAHPIPIAHLSPCVELRKKIVHATLLGIRFAPGTGFAFETFSVKPM